MAAPTDGPGLMRSMRVLAILAIAGLLVAGVLIDLPDRPELDRADQHTSALVAPTGVVNTWFCPGGSGPAGVAELTVQIVNGSDEQRAVTVSVLPGASTPQDVSTVELGIEPRGRVLLQPSEAVGGAEWVGVMVETRGAGVVVEQILTAAQGGVGRSPCLTETADSWVVSNGATRSAVERERFVVMLLNPFPDVAVADIELVADVGRDSIDGLVVPAQRVVAVDITAEVTVAATVAAFINVVSGRVAASWIQIADGPIAGRGARTAPAVPGAAELWHLPVAAVGPTRADVVAVSNPSATDVAEVDLEIIPEDPELQVSPIEITVRPGRTALVDLSRQGGPGGLGHFSVAVRSLTVSSLEAVPVAASITSVTSTPADSDGTGAPVVTGSTATIGADGAARRWLVTAEVPAADGAAGFDRDAGTLVIVNPSAVGIAEVDVSVGGSLIRSLEIGPRRIRRLSLASLGTGSFVVEVDSSAAVVVGREAVGLTSRSASLGVATEQPVPIAGVG
ncbi:MAG: hypothetical protein OXC00_16410 [Acidimicrobiaceae bacterium]|nr:hypothetical protein [Acidimicrobiaceae bacterium]